MAALGESFARFAADLIATAPQFLLALLEAIVIVALVIFAGRRMQAAWRHGRLSRATNANLSPLQRPAGQDKLVVSAAEAKQITDHPVVAGVKKTDADSSAYVDPTKGAPEKGGKDFGLKGYDFTFWFGLFVPKGTPQPIIDRLHDAVEKAQRESAVKKNFEDQGMLPRSVSNRRSFPASRIFSTTFFISHGARN